jgi:hypothetical protein
VYQVTDHEQIDSPFQLTEHLKSLHNAALHRDGSTTISPIDRETATRLAQPPDGVDKYLWLYELCRLLCKEINAMIVALFQDDPPCSAQTCNEMRASEWQYLCAVHDPPKPCCAIDYCCHTLDWTNHVLTSQKNFPSRMSLGADSGSGHQQLRQLTNIFRRVYRIFAHAWFQHRDMYWKVELKSGLYVFFKTVCDVYNLIPEDNYTVPPEAEGIEPTPAPKQNQPSIMKREEDNSGMDHERTEGEKQAIKTTTSTGSTTQRHRHTPSIGSESITTVLEDPEEDDDRTSKLEETVILSTEPPEEGPATEVASEEPALESSEEEPSPAEPEEPTTTGMEVPTIAIDHIEDSTETPVEPDSHPSSKPTDPEPEPELEAVDVGGEKADSTAASDTDSHGSWQVLTNEATEATPVSSADTEPVISEADIPAEKSGSSPLETTSEVEQLHLDGSGLSKELGDEESMVEEGSGEEGSTVTEQATTAVDVKKNSERSSDETEELEEPNGEKNSGTKPDLKAEAKDAEAATKTADD